MSGARLHEEVRHASAFPAPGNSARLIGQGASNVRDGLHRAGGIVCILYVITVRST